MGECGLDPAVTGTSVSLRLQGTLPLVTQHIRVEEHGFFKNATRCNYYILSNIALWHPEVVDPCKSLNKGDELTRCNLSTDYGEVLTPHGASVGGKHRDGGAGDRHRVW
jgi:hypothetical protein